MKIKYYKIFYILFFSVFICSCSNKQSNANVMSDIKLDSPITISKTNINQDTLVFIKLKAGRYYEDWSDTASIGYYGRNCTGNFDIIITDNKENILFKSSLNSFFSEQTLSFNDFFTLKLNDYNNDNHVDFTLGQYFNSCGTYEYRLFTIIDNKIVLIPVENNSFFSTSDSERYSINLTRINKNDFLVDVYSREKGKYITKNYYWDSKHFKYTE
ncbi:hypothetical protein PV797_04585 [Clostridiaceae bacterium M8S5]|nr:hypothetical protein PV797_04585 [Clostridiaceae bacterium M8S5]